TVLYLGGLLAAATLLRGRTRMLEPGLAAGVLIVIVYGLSERLLPGLLSFSRSATAGGRLEQPLTYWNAMGELAAIGLVLVTRLAGDRARAGALRASAAGAAAPLGLGLYLSFSRGALYAAGAGLLALILLVKRREQLIALAVTLGAAVVCSIVAAPFGGVTGLTGSRSARETQGAVMLAVLVAVTLVAALIQLRLARSERPRTLRVPAHAPWIVTALICAGLTVAIVVGTKETSKASLGAGASRLTTLQSDRYAYWGVVMRAFADEPLLGVGAENWRIYWLRDRPTDTAALDAHSLELQTLAELGLIGVAILAVLLGAIGMAGWRAHELAPELAAGPLAGLVVYLVHSPLDWDWQMPALTLVAVGLAGGVLALADSDLREDFATGARTAGDDELTADARVFSS
ncbi:MAG: hypothetical protein QOG59_2205, partial [Solirubrobacteraceae bacterium]|nr:hypothetical protein [Solirubrobacteraceae bacterium]